MLLWINISKHLRPLHAVTTCCVLTKMHAVPNMSETTFCLTLRTKTTIPTTYSLSIFLFSRTAQTTPWKFEAHTRFHEALTDSKYVRILNASLNQHIQTPTSVTYSPRLNKVFVPKTSGKTYMLNWGIRDTSIVSHHSMSAWSLMGNQHNDKLTFVMRITRQLQQCSWRQVHLLHKHHFDTSFSSTSFLFW